MAMKELRYGWLCLLLPLVTGCARSPSYRSTDQYTILVSRRKSLVGNPLIVGHTAQRYPDGSYHPISLAYISAATQSTTSNQDGSYLLRSSAGKQAISVRSVGYGPIVLKGVRVRQRDSIRIDFHLTADTTHL
jgi:hypothetical protein